MSRTVSQGTVFSLVRICEPSGPHPTIPKHYYEESFNITIIFQGQGVCTIEGVPYPLTDGTIMLIHPEDLRNFHLLHGGYHDSLTIHLHDLFSLFPNQDVVNLIKNLFQQNKWFPSKNYQSTNLAALLEELKGTFHEENPIQECHQQTLFAHILLILQQLEKQKNSLPQRGEQDERITEICSYINDHLAEDLTHEHLQKLFFVSNYLLGPKFLKQTGLPLTEYVITKRLMRTICLVNHGMGIIEASSAAGFNTYSHFYKVFKQHFGQSPSSYFKKSQ